MTLVKVKGAALKGRCKKKDRKKTRRGWAVRRRVLFFSLLLQNPIIGFLERQRDTEKPRRFKNRDTFPERIGRRTGGEGAVAQKILGPEMEKKKNTTTRKNDCEGNARRRLPSRTAGCASCKNRPKTGARRRRRRRITKQTIRTDAAVWPGCGRAAMATRKLDLRTGRSLTIGRLNCSAAAG